MTIDRALTVPGFMSPVELSYIAALAQRRLQSPSSIVVELGSWRGRSAVAWAENSVGRVLCVDTWDDSAFGCEEFPGDAPGLKQKPEWLLNEFRKNTQGLTNVVPMRMATVEAARVFASQGLRADVVFVDAGHLAHEVTADLNAWVPLLADGGVLCGHDYNFSGWPAVKEVVDRTVPWFRVVETIWTTEAEV